MERCVLLGAVRGTNLLLNVFEAAVFRAADDVRPLVVSALTAVSS